MKYFVESLLLKRGYCHTQFLHYMGPGSSTTQTKSDRVSESESAPRLRSFALTHLCSSNCDFQIFWYLRIKKYNYAYTPKM